MREILFRGKQIANGKWVYGFYVEAEKLDKSGIEYFIIEKSADGESHLIIPETVGQYTGLTDKNGKKIFEGDIVEFDEYIYSVEWKQDRCGFGYGGRADRMLEIDGEHCEVIGNVYEGEFYDSESTKEN